MRQTLFHVPHEVMGIPVFGWGIMLAVWVGLMAILSAVFWNRKEWRAQFRDSIPILLVICAAIIFLLPRLEARAPDGTILGLPIRGYGMMLLIGVVTGVGVTVRMARRGGIDADVIYSLAFWMFVAGITGARLFYVVLDWPSFRRGSLAATLAEVLKFTEGGLVVYGALAGGLIAFAAFVRIRRLPALRLADTIMPGMVLGLAFGRLGCLLNGCCYGGESHWTQFSLRFPRYSCEVQETISPPYWHQLVLGRLHGISIGESAEGVRVASVDAGSHAEKAGVRPGMVLVGIRNTPVRTLDEAKRQFATSGPDITVTAAAGSEHRWSIGEMPRYSLPVHPTQLYSAIDAALLYLFLWALFPLKRRDGVVFAAALTVYPVTRFLIEMIRDDEPGRFGTQMTIAQIISIAALFLVSILWLYIGKTSPQGSESQVAAT